MTTKRAESLSTEIIAGKKEGEQRDITTRQSRDCNVMKGLSRNS
ncbi:unnamed protein product [Haemonchus placei]|uniref:Uncharacterized protein n=1 Tax=Haemonchus placei TaxID=6290 RepID=A0A0N4X7P0_HAEPC|nr:unnamed protein product [Haemonchus placei]